MEALMLLNTESKDEFEKLVLAYSEDIRPDGFIERRYVEDIAYHDWEIFRWRSAKAEIVNIAMFISVKIILMKRYPLKTLSAIEILARGWFDHKPTKAEVLRMLRPFGLDETAFAAQALQLKAEKIEQLDRLEAAAEARREKALRMIVKLRKDFGQRLRRRSDSFLATEPVPALAALQ